MSQPTRLSSLALACLVCPVCRGGMSMSESTATCATCPATYAVTDGRVDLTPTAPVSALVTHRLDRQLPPVSQMSFAMLHADPASSQASMDLPDGPDLTYGNRLTPELLSYFPKADVAGGLMLDLGCGDRRFADICRRTGLDYVGLDVEDPAADLIGDAHRLPFADRSFDFVLAFSVMEHLRYPAVGVAEIFRVLKPGGRFIGTVAFMEPFHLQSFFHHSGIATWDLLDEAGFEVRIIAPSEAWAGLRPMAEMSLFPGLPRRVARAAIWPIDLLHRVWWRNRTPIRPTGTGELARLLEITGGFRFVVDRPIG